MCNLTTSIRSHILQPLWRSVLFFWVFFMRPEQWSREKDKKMEICMRAARLCSLTRVVTSCTSLIRTLYGPTAQRDTSDTLKREYTEQMTRWHIYFFTLCRCRSSHHYNTYRTTKPAPNSSRRVERHFTHISFIAAKNGGHTIGPGTTLCSQQSTHSIDLRSRAWLITLFLTIDRDDGEHINSYARVERRVFSSLPSRTLDIFLCIYAVLWIF